MEHWKPHGDDKIQLEFVRIIEVEGVDMADYPRFCDAYIAKAEYNQLGSVRLLTDEELESLPEDWVHEQITTHWIH